MSDDWALLGLATVAELMLGVATAWRVFGATAADLKQQAQNLLTIARSYQIEIERAAYVQLSAAATATLMVKDGTSLSYADAHTLARIGLDETTHDLTDIGALLAGMTPDAVAALFADLSDDQATKLALTDPPIVGNLGGVPTTFRSLANVARMNDDIAAVNSALRAHGVTMTLGDYLDQGKTLASLGLTTDQATAYRNAQSCLIGLAKDLANLRGVAVYLLVYDPLAFNGKGRAAIAVGDPDTANHIAVCVSGFGTTISSTLGSPDTQDLYVEAKNADPTNSTAVVQWMGYDAPSDLSVASSNAARNGAHYLEYDVAGLQACHVGPGYDLTVIGHSYGSTTVADAAVDGMRPTNIVLIGSPGTDKAGNASDLGLGQGHVFVGSASNDPVTFANADSQGISVGSVGIGADPATKAFGAARFDAEVATPGSGIHEIDNHLDYYTRGSESLYNMADVVTGDGGHITSDGMRAIGRYYAGSVANPFDFRHEIDPQQGRVATDDHFH